MLIEAKNTVTDLERKMIEEQFETFKYTHLHRIAFNKMKHNIINIIQENRVVADEEWIGVISDLYEPSVSWHDMDKIILYLCFSKRDTHIFHRANSRHHLENLLPKRTIDYVETIIDWECAGMTKPDKPLNAYDTLMIYYPEYTEQILPILQFLKMDSSYEVKLKLTEKEKEVTVDKIVSFINYYRNRIV